MRRIIRSRSQPIKRLISGQAPTPSASLTPPFALFNLRTSSAVFTSTGGVLIGPWSLTCGSNGKPDWSSASFTLCRRGREGERKERRHLPLDVIRAFVRNVCQILFIRFIQNWHYTYFNSCHSCLLLCRGCSPTLRALTLLYSDLPPHRRSSLFSSCRTTAAWLSSNLWEWFYQVG